MKNRHLIILIELLKGKYFDDYVLKSVLMFRIRMLSNSITCLFNTFRSRKRSSPLTERDFATIRRKRNKPTMIHKLLLLLSVSDLCVVVGLLASFCLPNIWPYFKYKWPYLAPWWIPILQIALLTSVYTTVLISLERYVRIVYICNLKECRFFNKYNFK